MQDRNPRQYPSEVIERQGTCHHGGFYASLDPRIHTLLPALLVVIWHLFSLFAKLHHEASEYMQPGMNHFVGVTGVRNGKRHARLLC
jgi:hypothetical protein